MLTAILRPKRSAVNTYPARINRSLSPSTRSLSLLGRSSLKQLIASMITRHCGSPVTALSAFRRALNSRGTLMLS